MSEMLRFCFVLAFVMLSTSSHAEGQKLKLLFGKNAKAIHIPVAPGKSLEIEPAFEDYAHMLEDACAAIGLIYGRGKCLI